MSLQRSPLTSKCLRVTPLVLHPMGCFTVFCASLRVLTRRCSFVLCCRRFVVLVSDANIEQYGITPAELGKLLRHQPNVRVFVIFIGECYHFGYVYRVSPRTHCRPSAHFAFDMSCI